MGRTENRTNRSKAVAVAALGSGLGIVFLSLGYAVPGIELTISLFIPLLSALVVLEGGKKAAWLFLAVSVPISFIDFPTGLFEYLPNVVIGLSYGAAFSASSSLFLSFFVLLSVSFGVNYAMIYPIDFFYAVSMEKIFATLFHIEQERFSPLFPLFVFFLNLVQSTATFYLCSKELEHLKKLKQERLDITFYSALAYSEVALSLIVIGAFFSFETETVGIALYIAVTLACAFLSFRFDQKNILVWEIAVLLFSLTAFVLSAVFLPSGQRILSLPIGLFSTDIFSLVMLKYNQIHLSRTPKKKVNLIEMMNRDKKD